MLHHVQTYLDRLKYALESGTAEIRFQSKRKVDENRNKKFTNRYTLNKLFPDEDEVDALRRELTTLTIDEYIETVKDTRFPKKSEMRVFGKVYSSEDVYIKIRVELINIKELNGNGLIFIMSFHFAQVKFKESDFPYKKI